MFRNPRENAARESRSQALPSIGRPPTPPTQQSKYFSSPAMITDTAPQKVQTPVLGRQPAPRVATGKKPLTKQNQSILSFFGKAEKIDTVNGNTDSEACLFFDDRKNAQVQLQSPDQTNSSFTADSPHFSRAESQGSRFNEDDTPVKKRRLYNESDDFRIRTPSLEPINSPEQGVDLEAAIEEPKKQIPKRRGGFVDDSDSENEGSVPWDGPTATNSSEQTVVMNAVENIGDERDAVDFETTSTSVPLKPPDDRETHVTLRRKETSGGSVPTLSRQGTSMYQPGEFDDDEDFEIDEFFEGGEEFMERQFMREQREMELAFEEDSKSDSATGGAMTPRTPLDDEPNEVEGVEDSVASCPLCGGSLSGLNEAQASSHVNACLDGTAAPLPTTEQIAVPAQSDVSGKPASTSAKASHRFQRAAVARPAQANPFSFPKPGSKASSAFTRLMSGHAEDSAWAEAAANESSSRGKMAYQRTCPFYKIMPGFSICVDAFRYGKVEGQNAYFLSHFHSDHYIGLTSSWCHGPIYASKVTCNLMRQQLRVDPQWIIPLEFEKKVEVPNTNGVFVTMIPANHCPGSSLYLFEKIIGKNRDGTPKFTRVLHCGDFRACPAHVNHPLLKPDVLDSVTGATKQQVIDTCYLDTTYLTPKYSFPSQHDVITACAQMCVSLSKEIVDGNDTWEKTVAARAGSAMTKFLEARAAETTKLEFKQEDQEGDTKPKLRGRLLVVIGTYSIGKERICLGIARALNSKIYAPPAKMRICRALEDPELNELLTPHPLEAQVHMQTLMEIRAETLHDYLVTMKPHFSRVVGFRPTGWSYRPPGGRSTENPAVQTVLYSEGWKSRFGMKELVPQRGSTKEANCFGVPYSEHSSFRELTMFVCSLRINRVVPTVNVGSARSREKMKGWIEKWEAEKRKNGLYSVAGAAEGWGSGDGMLRFTL